MKNRVTLTSIKWGYLLISLIGSTLLGCVQNEEITQSASKTIAIPIEINRLVKNIARSIDTQPYTVNRVLILPFKKIDETILTNDDNNFNLDQTAIKQVELTGNPTYLTMLELTPGATYKIVAIGYNQNNYDINNPALVKTFDLLYSEPNLLYSLYYYAMSAAAITDFFTATGMSYTHTTQTGYYFKPENINTLRINLTRSVSGLSVEIADIPEYVTSITLVAEKLVQSVSLSNFEALTIQNETADDKLKTFSTQVPDAGYIHFDHYLLPTFGIHSTRFYLDIQLGSLTERYLIKVNDVAGISSGNKISFYPNQVVKISGSYANINLGFTLNYSINLEDNTWDGIQ